MADTDLERRIAAVREFNRFYTGQIGLLEDGYLDSPFSLTQVRVLYELAHREGPKAGELAKALGLDPGYLSRILLGFRNQGLL
ncbi:MAG: MarR family transcriptional regulator, partial [Candidatus Limnocylindrales bacterium]